MKNLVRKIDREYRRKGHSPKRAAYIADATVYGEIEPRRRKKGARRSHRGNWIGENGPDPPRAPRRRKALPPRDGRGRFRRR